MGEEWGLYGYRKYPSGISLHAAQEGGKIGFSIGKTQLFPDIFALFIYGLG